MTRFSCETVRRGSQKVAFAVALAVSSTAAAGCSGADPSNDPGAMAPNAESTSQTSQASSAVKACDDDDDAAVPALGSGEWQFDDCSPTSHVLADSVTGATAVNARQDLRAHCVAGVSGLAVEFRSPRDVVEIPDAPQFAISDRVAVTAWVRPNTVTGHHPIMMKGRDDRASFSLAIHDGNVEMTVLTACGRTAVATGPITAGAWTNVAGWYDGTYLQVFVNGQGFPRVQLGGRLRNIPGPILVGARGERHFDGAIDIVSYSTQYTLSTELSDMACVKKPASISISPAAGGPVTFDTPVHYDVVVTNNSVGNCGPIFVNTSAEITDPTIAEQFANGGAGSIEPGVSTDIGVDVTANQSATAGVHLLPLKILVTFDPEGSDFSQQTSIEELSFDVEPASAQ